VGGGLVDTGVVRLRAGSQCTPRLSHFAASLLCVLCTPRSLGRVCVGFGVAWLSGECLGVWEGWVWDRLVLGGGWLGVTWSGWGSSALSSSNSHTLRFFPSPPAGASRTFNDESDVRDKTYRGVGQVFPQRLTGRPPSSQDGTGGCCGVEGQE